MKQYLERFKNVGTVMSLVGAVGLLLQQFGYNINLEWLNNVATTVCSILVILGICNNPNTPGMDLPRKEN